MKELQVFEYEEHQMRTLMIEDEPWFVAKDVCEALEIQNTTQAVAKLDDDERAMFNIGRQGETNFVNEFGLYNLILGSRKPEAKAFKRWVTHEVLPSIRKTGSYIKDESINTKREIEAFLMGRKSQDREHKNQVNNYLNGYKDGYKEGYDAGFSESYHRGFQKGYAIAISKEMA